jgi:CxxC motif-containing protein
MRKELTCIKCPMGCALEVQHNDHEIVDVKGNGCKKGLEYAFMEVFKPERIVTTTVKITGADLEFLPVKTDAGVPADMTFKVIELARKLSVKAPIKQGDILIPDILGTGSNLVATRSISIPEKTDTIQGIFKLENQPS